MSQSLRPLLRDVLVYGLSDGALRATALITLPLYARAFSPAEYGVWSTLLVVGLLLSALLVLGGDSAFARLWFDDASHEYRRQLTSTWLLFLAAFVGTLCLAAIIAAPWISPVLVGGQNHPALLMVALAAVPFTVVGAIAGQALRNQYRAVELAAHNATTAALSVGLGLFAVFGLHMGVLGVLAGHTTALALVLPWRLWAIRDLLGIRFSLRHLRGLLAFGVPLVPTTVAYWLFTSSDRILLARLADLHQVGLYAVAATVTGVLAIAHSAFGQAWSPRGLAAYQQDEAAARRYFGRVGLLILSVFGTLAVAGSLFADGGIRIFASHRYADARFAIAPLALAAVAQASTQVTASGISLLKKTHILAVLAWAAAILNVALNVLFIPRFGFVAAAWSTAASYVLLTLAYHVTTQRLWRIEYPAVRSLLAIGLVVFALISLPAVPTGSGAWYLASKAIALLCFTLLMAAITLGPRAVRMWRGGSGTLAKQDGALARGGP